MPDDRLFHKRLGHSDKIARLTDLEFRVWAQYELSADDFGVMRFSAVTLQADNDSLAKRQARQIQRGLEVLRDIGLIVTFEHQGRIYCAQADWQNYQRVKHPRQTINPRPTDAVMETFTAQTRALFSYWPGKKKETVGEDFGNPSAPVGDLARAGARETANGLRLAANVEGGPGETKPDVDRVRRFVDRYRDLHEQYIGVAYLGNPQKDYMAACELVAAFEDDLLEKLAVYGLNDADPFMVNGTRTLTKLKSRASEYAATLKAKRLA